MSGPDVALALARTREQGLAGDAPPRRPDWFAQALTHASSARGASYERLELLGDAVLGFLVADLLFRRLPGADEGELTKTRAELVNERSLARKARELGLGRAAAMAASEELGGGRDRPALLADLFESWLAAVYLSDGVEAARRFVEAAFGPDVDACASRDHKTMLQERAQAHVRATPTYRTSQAGGTHHEPVFEAAALIAGVVVGEGRGSTKKAAQQEAAREALARWDELLPELHAAIARENGARLA